MTKTDVNGVRVRIAAGEDADALFAIEMCSFTVPWSRESFASALSSDMMTVFAAEENGRVIGFGVLSVLAPEGEVLNIAVHPDARGSGTGRLILNTMLDHAKAEGADTVFLEVRETNAPARGLYESAGFTAVGVRKDYYDKPKENAVVMMKGLA